MNHKNIEYQERPPFLSAMCILTFIGSGLGSIVYLLAALFFGKATAIINKYSSMHDMEALSPLYFACFAALSAVSLAGALRIWKLHRDGFIIYTPAQIAMIALTIIWLGWNSFSVPGAIFTVIFVVGYGMNWKRMK